MASQLQPTYPVMLAKISPNVTVDDIKTFFQKYGPIHSVKRFPDKNEKGKFLFYVNFINKNSSLICSQQNLMIGGQLVQPNLAPVKKPFDFRSLTDCQFSTNCKNMDTCPYRHLVLSSTNVCSNWHNKTCRNTGCPHRHPSLSPREEKMADKDGDDDGNDEGASLSCSNPLEERMASLDMNDSKPRTAQSSVTNTLTRTPSQLEKIHECPICIELASNPYVLPCCKQLICKECLDELMDFSSDRYPNVECPTCRENHEVVTNIKLWEAPVSTRQTIDVLKSALASSSFPSVGCKTEGCHGNQDLVYCVEEKGIICRKCKQNRNPFHKFYEMKHSTKSESVNAFCKQHDSFQLQICTTCECLCCKYCELSEHKSHFTMELDAFNNMNNAAFTKNKDALNDLNENISTINTKIKTNLHNLQLENDRIKSLIKQKKVKCIFDCIYMLNSIEGEMIRNLDTTIDNEKAQLGVMLKLADYNQKDISSSCSEMEEFEKSSEIEKYFNWNDIKEHSLKTITKVKEWNPSLPELKFNEGPAVLVNTAENLFYLIQEEMNSFSFMTKEGKAQEDVMSKLINDRMGWNPQKDYDLCVENEDAMNEYLKQNFYKLVDRTNEETILTEKAVTTQGVEKKKKNKKKKVKMDEIKTETDEKRKENEEETQLDLTMQPQSQLSDIIHGYFDIVSTTDNHINIDPLLKVDNSDAESTSSTDNQSDKGRGRRNRRGRGFRGRGRGSYRGRGAQSGPQNTKVKNYRNLGAAESLPNMFSQSFPQQPQPQQTNIQPLLAKPVPMPYCHKCKIFGHLTKQCHNRPK